MEVKKKTHWIISGFTESCLPIKLLKLLKNRFILMIIMYFGAQCICTFFRDPTCFLKFSKNLSTECIVSLKMKQLFKLLEGTYSIKLIHWHLGLEVLLSFVKITQKFMEFHWLVSTHIVTSVFFSILDVNCSNILSHSTLSIAI